MNSFEVSGFGRKVGVELWGVLGGEKEVVYGGERI